MTCCPLGSKSRGTWREIELPPQSMSDLVRGLVGVVVVTLLVWAVGVGVEISVK